MKTSLKIKIFLLIAGIIRPKPHKIKNLRKLKAQSNSGKLSRFLDPEKIPVGKIKDKKILGRSGNKIPIRIYSDGSGEIRPVIVYLHGGGFVLCGLNSHDIVCRRLHRDNQSTVISVDYRLAPEHKFPAALEDSYDVVKWVSENAASLSVDPAKLTVMGDSAGGNLSAGIALMARDQKGPAIAAQILIYPPTDGNMQFESIQRYATGRFLESKSIRWFRDQYVTSEADWTHPYFGVYHNPDLKSLPPAFVFTAEFDPLRDEGAAYAKRLEEAGNVVKYKDYQGMIHGFINFPRFAPEALDAFRDIQSFLNELKLR